MKTEHPHSNSESKSPHTRRATAKFSAPPPVVPARVAAMKARYKQAWLLFLFAVSMLVAWSVPIRYAVTRYLMFRRAETGPRVSHSFVALAYEGISSQHPDLTPERFRDQIASLRRAGYHPITLRDIRAFYEEGTRLPEKAILLTFDQSRKSSYFEARSVLARTGWPAVMFLWTHPIQAEDPASLRWPYIRTMVRSGAWEAGAQGHRAFDRIPADSEGTLRNFLAAPRWIDEEMRHETPEAFSRRLQADHELAISLIRKETNVEPRAFAFPYGDFGQYDARALLSRRLNMDLISTYYDLGFIHGESALNTRHTDPRRLNRLLVRPEWSGDELVARLENAWPRSEGFTSRESLSAPLFWLNEWGGFEIRNGALRLFAEPGGTGAKAWVNGSDLYEDYTARFRLRIHQGQVGVYLRADLDGESHLYLVLGEKGDVWLRQKHAGLQPFTLGAARYTPDPDGSISLQITLRGRHCFISIGGRPVFQDILSIRGEPRPGMIGLSIWDPTPDEAEVVFTSAEVEPLRTMILTWPPPASRSPALAAWLNRNAVQYTHLAPPWLRITPRAQTQQVGWDPELFRHLSTIYSMKWMPEIILDSMDTFEAALPEYLANQAHEIGADGVFFNLSEVRGSPPLYRVTTWIQTFGHALEQRGLSLIVRLPESLEREATYSALFQSLAGIEIATTGDVRPFRAKNPEDARRLVRFGAADLEDIPTPIFHQLTGGDSVFDQWNTEIREALLRSEGYEAFEAGRFDQAIEIFQRWDELEPHNEEPPRWLGDVHLRLGDTSRAADYYRTSLDRNPGQIPLVIQTIDLLDEQEGRRDEALALLLAYTRLFPDNPDLLLAHAELLLRRNQPNDARRLIRRVIEDNPDDLAARALLHRLLPASRERMDNMRSIRDIGTRAGMAPHFANAVRNHHLLVLPESWILMDLIEERASEEIAAGNPGAYSSLTPRRTVVKESFRQSRLSDHWIAFSGVEDLENGTYLMGAGPSRTEAVLMLGNSQTMHCGFIEATIEESRGFFWLYARRGEGSMIRFGYEQDRYMYLQIWRDGRMTSNQVRDWIRPRNPFNLRLEIRGDAIFSYIDGKPAFGSPTLIPPDMGLGWWGISPWSSEFGVAQVALREVSGGPLPVSIALFWPRPQPWTDDEMVGLLSRRTQPLQAAAPAWFVHDLRGDIRAEYPEPFDDFRTWTRFYRIRLLPAIRSVSPQTLSIPDLVSLAQIERVDGFTLLVTRMPDDEWIQETEDLLAESQLSLLLVRMMRENQIAEVREIGPRTSLFSGQRTVQALQIRDMTEPADDPETEPDPPPAGRAFPPPPPQLLLF